MKKAFRLSALVLTLLFAFTLVACAPKDASAAKKKMEKKDYTVIVVTDSKEAEEGVGKWVIVGTSQAIKDFK